MESVFTQTWPPQRHNLQISFFFYPSSVHVVLSSCQTVDNYAIISLCRNQFLTGKQTRAELVDVKGGKKPHQIRTNQPFYDLQQISNLADSWGIFSVSNIKLWYFLSGQADRGLSPKAEPGCSFSWCLCCWRRSWCPPVRGVSRTMVTGERAVWKHF